MTIVERIEHAVTSFWAAVGAALVGGFVWFFRTVLTDQKRISAIIAGEEAREARRQADHEALAEIRQDISEVKRDVRELWKRSR